MIVNNSQLLLSRSSLVAQLIKNLTAMRETWVQSHGFEDPPEKGKATYSSILGWRIPWTVLSIGLQRVRHDWATFASLIEKEKQSVHMYMFMINFYKIEAV